MLFAGLLSLHLVTFFNVFILVILLSNVIVKVYWLKVRCFTSLAIRSLGSFVGQYFQTEQF